MNAIELVDIGKTFPVKTAKIEAVRDLSFSIDRGEVFGFLGPNGAGKSTTIKMLTGLIMPTSGRASIMGHDSASHVGRRFAGYLPENPAFYDYMTAWEYLAFVGRIFGMSPARIKEGADDALNLLDLWDARSRPIRGYSKGMVQRLGLAQALIHDPDVYILDEPMSGLDPVGRALVKQVIIELKKRGKCVFFSTHITTDVEAVCDRVGIILKGTLRKLDRVETILTEGLVGYQVRVKEGHTAASEGRFIPKEEFADFLKSAAEQGIGIDLVEPKRKDLESYFLDVVKGGPF